MTVVTPEAVRDLELHTAFGTAGPSSRDIRLIWSPVTTDIAGNSITVDHYVVYQDTGPGFMPGPTKELAATTGLTYLDVNAAGNTVVNYFYIVNARKSGYESTNSRGVGEFDRNLGNQSERLTGEF